MKNKSELICPKCKEEITYLHSEATATTGVDMNMDGEISYDEGDMNSIAEIDEWRCPECDEVLAWNEEEAINFLKKKINKVRNPERRHNEK